jgi:molybdenum cofactor cytidylyltransferase
MLAAIILSGGASSRMGSPKALLPYGSGNFLEHLVAATRHPRVGITRVVLGAGADNIRTNAKLDCSTIVINQDWEQGQLSSIRAGLRSIEKMETDGMILCPVDHPLVSPALIGTLIEHFYAHDKSIVMPTYKGRRGHPVIFSSALYGELLAAPVDKGARAVVWAHSTELLEVVTGEEGVVLNLNDPETLRKAISAGKPGKH